MRLKRISGFESEISTLMHSYDMPLKILLEPGGVVTVSLGTFKNVTPCAKLVSVGDEAVDPLVLPSAFVALVPLFNN